MEAKKLAGTILSVSCKTLIFVMIALLMILMVQNLYDFGQRIFREEAKTNTADAVLVTVAIPEDSSALDVANIMVDYGVVEDSKLFFVQLMLSDYKDKIVPGVYTLSTDMKPTEIMKSISPETEESEE